MNCKFIFFLAILLTSASITQDQNLGSYSNLLSNIKFVASAHAAKVPPPKNIKKKKEANSKSSRISSAKETGKRSTKTEKSNVKKTKDKKLANKPQSIKKTTEKTTSKNSKPPTIKQAYNYNSHGPYKYAAPNKGFLGKTREITLKLGSKIDRYGNNPRADFFAPAGTKYEKRSLPAGSKRQDYTVYKVLKPLPVTAGSVAPAYGKNGLGVQYQTKLPLKQLLKEGYIKEVKKVNSKYEVLR